MPNDPSIAPPRPWENLIFQRAGDVSGPSGGHRNRAIVVSVLVHFPPKHGETGANGLRVSRMIV